MGKRHVTRATWVPLFLGLVLHAGMARADGDPGPGFGDGQQIMLARPVPFPGSNAQLGDVATLADGRIVWTMENGVGGLWVARMLHDGQMDPSFANGGVLELTDCVAPRPARLLAFADHSLLLWAGGCMLKLRADGSTETHVVPAEVGPSPGFFAIDLLRDADGRWLLAGNENQNWRVYRFLGDGRIDPGFAAGGVATIVTPSTNGSRTLHAMTLRADGRIVLAGSRGNTHGTNLVLAGLDASGGADPAFGDGGLVDLAAPSGYNSLLARALLVDVDGSLVVAGDANNGMQSCCVMIARFAADGALNPVDLRIFRLGDNVSLSPFGETSASLALLPHGKILLARISFPFVVNTRTRFTLLRLHRDGSFDTSFNGVGWRSYVAADPTGLGQTGPYSQIHGMTYANGEALMFGRTFFEDESVGVDYVTLMRARFDAVFAEGFDP